MHNWLKNFFEQRNLPGSTGEPLYTYRCSNNEYEMLCRAIPKITPSYRSHAALFCLFAAEWWRRHYSGGAWRWEDLQSEAGLSHWSAGERNEIIINGLKYWKRRLLRYADDTRRAFLITLACEGGLPLKLLHNQNARLYCYFKALLQEKQNFQTLPTERLAQQLDDYLPQGLRRDMVYALSSRLIEQILDLQKITGDADNPIAFLDRHEPDWRRRMPLELEDDLARVLLDSLVAEAVQLQRIGQAKLGMKRLLHKAAENTWILQGALTLPGAISPSQLQELTGTVPDGRCEFYLLTPTQDRILWAFLSPSHNGDYLIEPQKRLYFQGKESAGEFKLTVRENRRFSAPVILPGGEALGDLPWVFVDREEAGENLEWIGSGAACTRYDTAWVAVSPESQIKVQQNSRAEPMGIFADRTLYRVQGTVLIDTEGDVCSVKTQQLAEAHAHFYLQGETVPYGKNASAVFLGLPALVDSRDFKAVPAEKLTWQSSQGHHGRQPWDKQCCGQGVLRYLDDHGELKFRASVALLPAQFKLRAEQGRISGSGTLYFEGIGQAMIKGQETPGISFSQAPDNRQAIHCVAENQPPATIHFMLCCQTGSKICLELPFPVQKGCFIGGEGRILSDGARVPVNKLSGIKAMVLNPSVGRRFRLTAILKARHQAGTQNFWFETFLEQITAEHYEYQLRDLKSPILMLLSATPDLDATVELRVETAQGQSAALQVAFYDVQTDPDKTADIAYINEEDVRRLGAEGLQNLQAEIRPLWNPEVDADLLQQTQTGTWAVNSTSRTHGPWLITVRDGAWQRARPLLWSIGQNHETHTTQLQQAICLAAPEQRKQALASVIETLSTDPNHPGWDTLLQYFKTFGDLPPHSLDVFVALSEHPRAAVMALFKSDCETFEVIWSLLKQLPFSWLLVPLQTWGQVACCHANALYEALRVLPCEEDTKEHWFNESLKIFFAQLSKEQHPAASVLSEWMRRDIYGYFHKQDKELPLATQAVGQQILQRHLGEVQQELLRRQANNNTDWPHSNPVREWIPQIPENFRQFWLSTPPGTGFRKPVLNAPVIAALSCVLDIPVDTKLLYEIRRLRLFDIQWFDEAYRLILTLAAGRRIEQGQT